MIKDTVMIRQLVQQVSEVLLERKQKLVTAESCTGGGIGFVLTDLAGSSVWLEGGFITYSNEAKQQHLDVSADTLEQHGAVSEETASQMAQGALANSPADYSLSVTGIAGPAGGSKDKPVGTVSFGWADRNGRVATETQVFSGDRAEVREQTIVYALSGLLRFLN